MTVAGVNAWVAREQWKAMEIQGDIMNQQLVASRRPWVGVELSVAGGFEVGQAFRLIYKA